MSFFTSGPSEKGCFFLSFVSDDDDDDDDDDDALSAVAFLLSGVAGASVVAVAGLAVAAVVSVAGLAGAAALLSVFVFVVFLSGLFLSLTAVTDWIAAITAALTIVSIMLLSCDELESFIFTSFDVTGACGAVWTASSPPAPPVITYCFRFLLLRRIFR